MSSASNQGTALAAERLAKNKLFALNIHATVRSKAKGENEPFSTAERSERVENFLFRATREYTEAGIEQAIVAMRRLGANSPEPRKRAVHE